MAEKMIKIYGPTKYKKPLTKEQLDARAKKKKEASNGKRK